jgi:hypothetical protein
MFDCDTWFQNKKGPRKIKDLSDKTDIQELYELKTMEGFSIKLTKDHFIKKLDGSFVNIFDLLHGDKIKIYEQGYSEWEGKGNKQQGYLLGLFVDKFIFRAYSYVNTRPFGEIQLRCNYDGFDSIKQEVEKCWLKSRSQERDRRWVFRYDDYKKMRFSISQIPQEFGFSVKGEGVFNFIINEDISIIEDCSYDFYVGFLRGIFDFCGHIEGSNYQGYWIRLEKNNFEILQSIQRMLLRLGIYSKISKIENCWNLFINNNSVFTYYEKIGFIHSIKEKKLENSIEYLSNEKNKFYATFEFLDKIGNSLVYEIKNKKIVANGFVF